MAPVAGVEPAPSRPRQRVTKPAPPPPSQTAEQAQRARDLRRMREAARTLGAEVVLQLRDTRNPLWRGVQDIGQAQDVAARVKATAAARKLQRETAAARAQVGARDAGRTVIFDTAGRRYRSFLEVPKNRKVFVVRPDRLGRLRYLNAVDPKTLMPGVRPQLMAQAPARFDFRRWAAQLPREYGAVAGALAAKARQPIWRGQGITYQTRVEKNDLDTAARKVANVFEEAARSQQGITQWVGDILINVRGERKPLRLTTPVLNAGQFFELPADARQPPRLKKNRGARQLLQRVVQYKIRDLVRAELAGRGLVSRGSARRIATRAWNRGRPRREWTTDPERTTAWKGRDKADVELGAFQFRLRKIF